MPIPQVVVKKGEPVDRALKRLKNKLESEGILEEVRRLRAFETPLQRTRRKARANAKRSRNKFRFQLHDKKPENREGGAKEGGAAASAPKSDS